MIQFFEMDRGISPICITNGNLNQCLWKQKFSTYLKATEIIKKEDATKCAHLLTLIGDEGVSHGDDLGYLFHSDISPEVKPGSPEDKSVRTFVELWTNFAANGNPTPDDKFNIVWEPVKRGENIKLLDIGEKLKFKDIPESNRLRVWWDILKKWPFTRFY